MRFVEYTGYIERKDGIPAKFGQTCELKIVHGTEEPYSWYKNGNAKIRVIFPTGIDPFYLYGLLGKIANAYKGKVQDAQLFLAADHDEIFKDDKDQEEVE